MLAFRLFLPPFLVDFDQRYSMRIRSVLAGSAIFFMVLAAPANSQTSQISKRWELGHHSLAEQLELLAQNVEHKDGRFDDQGYVQRIEDRVAAFDRGETPAYAAEDVFAEARRLSR